MTNEPAHIRTAISLPPELMRLAKQEARSRYMTFSGFVRMSIIAQMNGKPE